MSCGTLSGGLLGSGLLGVVVGPGLSIGLLGVVGGPSLGVSGLLLSVSSLGLGSSIVTGGRVTVLSVRNGGDEEAGGKCEADDCFHDCVSGSCLC